MLAENFDIPQKGKIFNFKFSKCTKDYFGIFLCLQCSKWKCQVLKKGQTFLARPLKFQTEIVFYA